MAPKNGEHLPESEQKTACSASEENLAYWRNTITDYHTTGKMKDQ